MLWMHEWHETPDGELKMRLTECRSCQKARIKRQIWRCFQKVNWYPSTGEKDMNKMMTLTCAAVMLFAAQGTQADVLWDQSDYNLNVPGFFDHENGSPPFGMSVYTVSDITVTGGGWNVTSISTYYSVLGDLFATEARLHVFAKSGPLPLDALNDPTMSPIVSVTTSSSNNVGILTVELDLDLAAGEYWIGLTPIFAIGDPILLSSMSTYGDASASYDAFAFPGPPTWFNFNPGVDASIMVEGTAIPAPGALALLGLAGVGFRRRRRSLMID